MADSQADPATDSGAESGGAGTADGRRQPALEGIDSSTPPGGRPAPPPGASASQTAAGAARTGGDDGMSGAYRKPEAAGDTAQPGPSLDLPTPSAGPGGSRPATGRTLGASRGGSAGAGPGAGVMSEQRTDAATALSGMPDAEIVRREATLQESIDQQDEPPDSGSGVADFTDGPQGPSVGGRP
jgi:hypothetical protein